MNDDQVFVQIAFTFCMSAATLGVVSVATWWLLWAQLPWGTMTDGVGLMAFTLSVLTGPVLGCAAAAPATLLWFRVSEWFCDAERR